ncbi:hypothetical protein R3P38DRAFT_3271754 [Favolaschia claudopus]|uniref:F-box domain-containing protein n=1 Tax=Favolaschia claudopus TaxID=2862362 RepID=A0AAW0B783_9AGAR
MSHLIKGVAYLETDNILTQIFREFVFLEEHDVLQSGSGPWLISHVCRSWRNITIAHPELWTIVRVLLEDDPDKPRTRPDEEQLLSLMKLALERSQSHSLNITLNFTLAEGILAEHLIRAAVAHSDRWEKADLVFGRRLSPQFAPIRNHLSRLTELTLWSLEDSVHPFKYVQHAPKLTRVTLEGFHHGTVPLPWHSIVHFSEKNSDQTPATRATSAYLDLFRRNPQLESFELTYVAPRSSPQSVLTHASLRRLATSEPIIIQHLTLPRLEELVVKDNEGTLPAINFLLRRSKCSLRSLRLLDFAFDAETTTLLSLCNDSLHSLTVEWAGYDENVNEAMEIMVQKLSEPSFLPYLQSLEILINEDRDSNLDDPVVDPLEPCTISFINDAFVKMLVERWGRRGTAKAAFQRACIIVEVPSTLNLSMENGIGRLQQMSDQGLDIAVVVQDPRGMNFDRVSYVYTV